MIPRLHVITHDHVLARDDFESRARSLLDGTAGTGAVALHLRGRKTSGRRLFELARDLLSYVRPGSLLIVNDRVDVAMASGAHGVHLREWSIPLAEARSLVAAGVQLGRSVHDVEGAMRAASADYLFAGAIFSTATHPGEEGQGTAFLEEILRTATAPVLAIGGITLERAAQMVELGAHGVAILRGAWNSEDPAGTLARYADVCAAAGGDSN